MCEMEAFARSDVSQESQYALPYHYIPTLSDGRFAQHLYWSWGYHYLGGLRLALTHLESASFESLVDIGCGDGRFLRELRHRFPEKQLLGIDYSQRAIGLAGAMNPDLRFRCADIYAEEPAGQFDVVTLLEVLEHIPIDRVDSFVAALSRYLEPGGRLLLTVPHQNKARQEKHYQHFTSESLEKVLAPHFEIETRVFFDKRSRLLTRMIDTLLRNRLFILNNRTMLSALFTFYCDHLLYCDEKHCGRLFVRGRRR